MKPKTEKSYNKKAAPPMLGPGLVSRSVRVDARDALLVKAVVEAHEGVATIFGDETGMLVIAAPCDREAELDELVADITVLIATRGVTRPITPGGS